MGGGISSAASRALGSGDEALARALALHAVVIGVAAGLFFTVLFLAAGPLFYRLGQGPFPRWRMNGVVLAQVLAFSGAALVLLAYSRSARVRLPLQLSGIPQRQHFMKILRVGGLACLSPLQTGSFC